MDKKKSQCDDDYWGSAQKGFAFDEDWQPQFGDSKLSTVIRQNKPLNQLENLSGEGLTEIAENSELGSAKDFLAFNLSQAGGGKSASALAKSFNPLEIHQKKQSINTTKGPEETVKSMILGLEYSFEQYKGKREKLELLNASVRSHDGNAIIAVVLFLRETLKKSIFQREILDYPDAVNVYLAYLEEDREIDELANMLLLLNKAEDAAILKYETAVKVQHPERKIKWIENCLSTHFQLNASDVFLRQSVEEHKQLLEEQIKLEQYSHSVGPEIMDLFESLTGKKTIVDSSILCSLILCCLCNFSPGSGELSFAFAEKIKSNYNLSKKQYTWAVLRALTASQRWLDIDELFMSKNWLGGIKFRSCITCSRILEVLSKAKAPNEVLSKYVSCVEDEEEKLALAKKYGCHNVVIEVFKNAKDRQKLIEYRASLLPHSVDFCNATDILNNPMIRWKN